MEDRLHADLRRLEEVWRTKEDLLRASARPRKFGDPRGRKRSTRVRARRISSTDYKTKLARSIFLLDAANGEGGGGILSFTRALRVNPLAKAGSLRLSPLKLMEYINTKLSKKKWMPPT